MITFPKNENPNIPWGITVKTQDSALEHARNEHVPVDEFTDFAREAPHCSYCGSYEVEERTKTDRFGNVRLHAHHCIECGHEMRSEGAQVYANRRQHNTPSFSPELLRLARKGPGR